jgi:hypothetical protein
MFLLAKVPTSSVAVTGLGVPSSRFSSISSLLSRPPVKGAIVTLQAVIWVVPSCRADVGRYWRGKCSSGFAFDDEQTGGLLTTGSAALHGPGCQLSEVRMRGAQVP